MKNILDILYEYTKKNEVLDIEALKKIIDIYIKEYNIDIVKRINIITKKDKLFRKGTLGIQLDDKIDIYYIRILEYLEELDFLTGSYYEDDLDPFEFFLRSNIYILETPIHELEHALQLQVTRDSDLISYEDQLITVENCFVDNFGLSAVRNLDYDSETNEFIISKMDQFRMNIASKFDEWKYRKNYNISLLERLADIDSLTKVVNSLEEIKNEIPNLYNLMNELLLMRKLRDYDSTIYSPTIDFFDNLLGFKNEYTVDIPTNYTKEEKLRLGLPITAEEYEEEFVKIKKY